MAHINWTIEVPIDPVTLSPAPGGIPIPTYGYYGGPDYSNGSVGGTITIGAHAPVDNLDTLFFYHDLAYQQQPLSKDIPSADLALTHGIELLTAAGQLDAEASLYAGATILVVISSMAVNGNLPSPSELLTADATAVYDIQYGLSHLTPTERGLAQNFLLDIAEAFLTPASMHTQDQYISDLLAQVTDTTIPAVAVEASMYGAVGTSDEITLLATQFLPAQVEHAISSGLDPLVYASEALGLAFAFGNENGSTGFAAAFGPADSAMPSSTAGDAAFAKAAASTIFGSASTDNLVNAIESWVSNWKAFYSSHGVPGISNPTAAQIDLAARGAAWGDAVGVELANNLGPLKGQVINFLIDAAQGTAVYSASLASQPSHADAATGSAASADATVNLTGIAAAHVDHLVA
jgi:hypothetical protein